MKTKFFPTKLSLITLVAACFVVNASMGVRQTFGLFSNNFESDCGISNTEFGLAVALHSIVWGIFTPIFGRFADKYGGSKIVILGLICYAIGTFSLGNNLNTGLWFQLNLGLMVGIGLGACSGPMLAPLATKHFPNEKRSKAAGFVTAFGGLGMFMFPALSNFLITETSWETTFTVFGTILLLMCIPAFFLRNPESENKQNNFNMNEAKKESAIEVLKESLKHKGFRLLILGFFVCGFQITWLPHVPRYVQDRGLED